MYRNFLCLKVFELKLKLSHYNLFFWAVASRKWSKHRFHWYMVCHALEKHAGAISGKVKLQEKPCGKENLGRISTMTIYNWVKLKFVLLYYSWIKYAFQCFLQLGDMCFSSWGIIFCVTSLFRNFVGQISSPFPKNLKWNIRVAVVLAILVKCVFILKLGLRSLSRRITSLIFWNIFTPPQHALTLQFSLFWNTW